MEKAVQIKNAVLLVFATGGSCISNALGGWDKALSVLIGLMAADYITGVLVAAVFKKSAKSENGKLESGASFKGLCRKCMILVIVWVAVMLDKVTGSNFIRTTVCLFFIANEGLSLLENTSLMGVPFPKFMKNMFEAMREQAEQGSKKHN